MSETMIPEPGGQPMVARGEGRTPGETPLTSRLEPGGRPMVVGTPDRRDQERTPGEASPLLTSEARRATSGSASAASPGSPAFRGRRLYEPIADTPYAAGRQSSTD